MCVIENYLEPPGSGKDNLDDREVKKTDIVIALAASSTAFLAGMERHKSLGHVIIIHHDWKVNNSYKINLIFEAQI